MCSFKFLTFKFGFDIIKIEHRFLSSIVCLFNYNFGASYALFQYLFLIIPHFSVMRVLINFFSEKTSISFIIKIPTNSLDSIGRIEQDKMIIYLIIYLYILRSVRVFVRYIY